VAGGEQHAKKKSRKFQWHGAILSWWATLAQEEKANTSDQ